MRIIVDADACPGREIIEKAAQKNYIEVIMYCDINHILKSDYSKIVYVDSGFQSVDMKIANEAKKGDIVITQDFGVAAMVLGKNAYALSPKGNIYSNDNIERLLFERHLGQKVRRGGGRTVNHKKRDIEDDKKLYNNLIKIISYSQNL
ncbi:MAG: YaiI/YqxD family protein [Clostridium sp.]|mgnify:CR=1 FL=1|uniref:YaiI/YqxD family protein n=1 Tax=Clostridium sp. TaxID=1506 RepID=UPI0039E85FA3